MAAHDKPYLFLQLDDHDSSVGYETRIEAAIAAFKSHHGLHTPIKKMPSVAGLLPRQSPELAEKTLLIPCWDEVAQRLVVANLQKEGFDARLLQGNESSMRFNSGQCIPLNIIAQALIDYVERHDLDPGRTVLWLVASQIACNIGLYAHQTQTYLKMIAQPYLRKWFVEGRYLEALSSRALIATISRLEKTDYKYFQCILEEPEPVYDESPEEILSAYGICIENSDESMENILKIHYLKKYHPDIALFVQISPAFCCPSLVTEAMAGRIERRTHTPMVSITYDGTGGNKNEILAPYLAFPRKMQPAPSATAGVLFKPVA